MKLSGWVVGAAALVLAMGCSNTPKPMTDADRAALADSVSHVATQWLASLATGPTTDQFYSAFVRGNDLAHAQYGTILPTYDSLITMASAFFRPLTSMRMTFTQKKMTVLDRDVVVMTTIVSGTMTDSAGKETPMQLAWTAVWHRTPDGWKVAADHESMAPPAPTPTKPARRN